MQKKVIAGISGGIAAFKAADLVSRLTKADLNVRVIMTKSATNFVTPLTFAALTQQKVLTTIFPENSTGDMDVIYPHLYPATEADLFVVAPATANTIAKLAHGLGDDIVSCSALSLPQNCKRIFCPAMNVQMWEQDAVQENIATLIRRGWQQIGPESGPLACGTEGEGRMSSPATIEKIILSALS